MSYRFTLEPYKSMKMIYKCPNCNKKTFTRYIDTETNEYLDVNVGRCSREIKCGYHYKPKDYFENDISLSRNNYKNNKYQIRKKPAINKVDYINKKHLITSLNNTNNNINNIDNIIANNNFIMFLYNTFGIKKTLELINTYKIGTSNHWKKSTVFWQIDINCKIRTGKIMLYSPTGKRVKKPFNHINWAHRIINQNNSNNQNNYHLQQCLFGEHLLNNNSKNVAIVESEKTAIISSVFYPEFIWLATGGLSNLTYEKTKVLKNRNVILFPDLNAFEKWEMKKSKLSPLINIRIYDGLEKKAAQEEKDKGYDIADYLLKVIGKV